MEATLAKFVKELDRCLQDRSSFEQGRHSSGHVSQEYLNGSIDTIEKTQRLVKSLARSFGMDENTPIVSDVWDIEEVGQPISIKPELNSR